MWPQFLSEKGAHTLEGDWCISIQKLVSATLNVVYPEYKICNLQPGSSCMENIRYANLSVYIKTVTFQVLLYCVDCTRCAKPCAFPDAYLLVYYIRKEIKSKLNLCLSHMLA